jgi:hypothetical protein
LINVTLQAIQQVVQDLMCSETNLEIIYDLQVSTFCHLASQPNLLVMCQAKSCRMLNSTDSRCDRTSSALILVSLKVGGVLRVQNHRLGSDPQSIFKIQLFKIA